MAAYWDRHGQTWCTFDVNNFVITKDLCAKTNLSKLSCVVRAGDHLLSPKHICGES